MEGCLPRTEEDDKLDAIIINEPYNFVAQWLEHPTGVRKVIGSIPVGDPDDFFVPCWRHVDHIISHFFTELKFAIFLYISHT